MVRSYIILSANDTYDLSKDVNKHLNSGWNLVGGVTSTVYISASGTLGYTFYQALIREFDNG